MLCERQLYFCLWALWPGVLFLRRLIRAPPPQPLSFSGNGLAETTIFTTHDRWEVRWEGIPASVSVEDANGTVLAGAGGNGGTLYMPAGGSFKLRISPNDPAQKQWRVEILQVGAAGQTIPKDGDVASLYVPPDMTVAAPVQTEPTMAGGSAQVGGPAGVPSSSPSAPSVAVVPATGSAPTQPNANFNPNVNVNPPANSGNGSTMTAAQTAAVVLIRGDNAEGTGFLVKTAAGSFVVTNQHVISANPHLQITTTGGATVKPTGLQGAADRDLAMIPIQDNNYSYLELATDVASTVQVGDAVVTPGNSQGGEVMLNTSGTVVALGPQKVEISNPVYHGNSGGPILHLKSGKVIGVVTEGLKVDVSDSLDQASFQNRNSAIRGSERYFGLRLDNVATWQTFAWGRFQNETEFLREFHERSLCLDSYLNTGIHDTSDWGTYYAKDDKVKEANEAIGAMDADGDASTRIDTARNLVFTLGGLADTDMDQIQLPANFYGFDAMRAKDEMAYRQALKKEIEQMGDNVERLGGLARQAN
jgi:S1-C subfamily serine protease